MFTAYFPELHRTTVEVLERNRQYFKGEWNQQRLDTYQLSGLRETLRFVKENSPFYRTHFQQFDNSFIENLTLDTFKSLPFTTKQDLREQMHGMLSRPLDQCCFFYETTGTTGPATPCPRDYVDTIYNNIAVTTCVQTLLKNPLENSGKRHFVGICGPTELHSFGDTLGDVCRNMGLAMAKFWAYSPVVGLKKSIQTMKELGITALMCTPGMALSKAKLATELGYDLKKDFNLDLILMTGELGSPAMMHNIGEMWGAKGYNFLYGAQEALVLATATNTGRLHTFPTNFYYEVINPRTGSIVSPQSGIRFGELVISMLFQGSKPLLRYRTGDLVRLYEGHDLDQYCAPVVEVLGRTKDDLTINGETLQGYDLEQLLLEGATDVFGYRLTISNTHGRDAVVVDLDLATPSKQAELVAGVTKRFQQKLGLVPAINFGTLNSLGSTGALVSWKAARIMDQRDSAADGLENERRAAAEIAAKRDRSYAGSLT